MHSPALSTRLFAAALLLAVGTCAWAHAALTRSVPGNREVLARSPATIDLKFNEKIEAKFSKVSVEDAQGKLATLGVPTVAADDPYALQTAVSEPLAPGRYTVRYRVLSQDGHVIERSFVFTVEAPTPPTPGP
ncbi:MAG: copper resistance CopC family protein [Panacagrimonas sp.]